MTTFLQSFLFFGISSVSLSQKTENKQVNFGVQVCLTVDSWAKRLRFLYSLVYKLILKAGRFGFIFLVSQVGCSVVSQLQQNFFRCCIAQRSESRWTNSFRHNNKAIIFNWNQIFHYTRSNELTSKYEEVFWGTKYKESPFPRHCACGEHNSFGRNVATMVSRWQRCVRFDRPEIWTSDLPLQRRTRYRSTN